GQSVVKVDDTTSGVGEGLEAGCWTVGIARYSNYMDIDSLEDADRLSAGEPRDRVERTRDLLWRCGAHYVIDEPLELLSVIDDVEARLDRGERP
ncbi:MAG: phosphonoacetaldehyde hydrolase, partial [Acidimicrobiales bacterium]